MDDKNPRILIVDDEADVAEMFAAFLSHSGYETAIAHSATDALMLARSLQFDLVLSDIGMPVMNGYELVAALRKLPGYRSTPIIAVTGFSIYDDRERSFQAGFNAHLVKPVLLEMLLNQIKRLQRK